MSFMNIETNILVNLVDGFYNPFQIEDTARIILCSRRIGAVQTVCPHRGFS